ncbi:MAG: DUF3793 family protein [Oscillospiraceae bacterium]
MSEMEQRNFGKLLAYHTAPTLLGIKCASLVSLSREEYDVDEHSCYFNRRTAAKGLKSRVLCGCGGRVLLLVYNESLLAKRLSDSEVRRLLKRFGYGGNSTTEECLDRLSQRIQRSGEFPHEIGLFLDYPVEDVVGFIRNKGGNYKLCGCWKVYGSEESARRTFANYDKCRKYLCNKLNEGADIYQALKIS